METTTMSAQSIREQIRQELLDGKMITPFGGFLTHHTGDLRKRLSELRAEGMDISFKNMVSASTGKRYRMHYMTKEAINKWKEQNKYRK